MHPSRPARICALLAALAAPPVLPSPAEPEWRNLAPRATITGSGQFSHAHRPALVADGRIPAAESRSDEGQAWCLPAAQAAGATLTFTWPEPVPVAEVVFYGRTAWLPNENFRSLEVIPEGAPALGPFLLAAGHGPQRVRLPKGLQTRALTLRFPTCDDGPNPGAAEIMVLDKPSRGDLPGLIPPADPALAARLASGGFGFTRLLVAQRRAIRPSHVYTYHCEGLEPGGGLFVLDLPTGALTPLVDAGRGVILDCEVSYDGSEALFSWNPDMGPFQVYRVGLDGSPPRRLTDGPSLNFNPCWLPDGGIAFLSTRRSAYAYCWSSPAGILHRMDGDGGGVRALSANYLNDFTPAVLNDGRIIYSRWEYVDRPAIPIQSLWTINPDGGGLRVYYGNRVLSPATFMEPRPIPGSEDVLCVLTAHNGPCRGAIGRLDRRAGVDAQEAIHNLTPEVPIGRVDQGDGNTLRGPYEAVEPLDGEFLLASRMGTVIVRDRTGARQATVLPARGELGFYQARPLRARPRPPVIATPQPPLSGDPAPPGDTATVHLRDVYDGLEPAVRRGEIHHLRVVQEVAKPVAVDPARRLFGFQFPVVSCGATYAPKKIWGDVPVERDGSASFRVPAGLPLSFYALDAEGRAVQRMRSFAHFAPGETQSCVGCHEHRSRVAAPGARALSLLTQPRDLTPPEWGVKGFSYLEVVQPVLDRHCVSCHGARNPPAGVDLAGDRTELFNVSYENLARRGSPAEDSRLGGHYGKPFATRFVRWIPTYNGTEANILENEPRAWGSPASPLAELVRSGHPDAAGRRRVDVPDADRRRLFAWMDCNAPYYPTSASHDLESPGCRRVYPERLDAKLEEVARRRCAECHADARVPRDFYTRIERPEDNAFLLAPLARAAGGTEACGRAVFASRTDPDYRALLDTFADIPARLAAKPRLDILTPENTRGLALDGPGACPTATCPVAR